mmetsp:Transcript_26607/g.106592  ORF Transcript_26607/g.106592 Transcript_26607/m.106592 type:complete len:270 (+) Transcript_26607:54-863(+)
MPGIMMRMRRKKPRCCTGSCTLTSAAWRKWCASRSPSLVCRTRTGGIRCELRPRASASTRATSATNTAAPSRQTSTASPCSACSRRQVMRRVWRRGTSARAPPCCATSPTATDSSARRHASAPRSTPSSSTSATSARPGTRPRLLRRLPLRRILILGLKGGCCRRVCTQRPLTTTTMRRQEEPAKDSRSSSIASCRACSRASMPRSAARKAPPATPCPKKKRRALRGSSATRPRSPTWRRTTSSAHPRPSSRGSSPRSSTARATACARP